MGMMFGGWAREEEEEIKASGLSREAFYQKEEWYRNNHVYPPSPKRAIYRGIELEVGDRITPALWEKTYIIRDFEEDGAIPIVDLVDNRKHEYFNKPWEFDTILKLVTALE